MERYFSLLSPNFGKNVENESQSAVVFSSVILSPVKFSGVLQQIPPGVNVIILWFWVCKKWASAPALTLA